LNQVSESDIGRSNYQLFSCVQTKEILYTLAKKQMKRFGGVVSFELKGDLNRTMRFVDKLKLALLDLSLDSAETLISQPSAASHFFIDHDEALPLTNESASVTQGAPLHEKLRDTLDVYS
jgi:O-acetylhomoserine/O-acetylserine sulfhydrylase-like pyridoxal-dependent enzyme